MTTVVSHVNIKDNILNKYISKNHKVIVLKNLPHYFFYKNKDNNKY